VLLVVWFTALPDYFGGVDGITSDGTPTGNVFYAAAIFALACLPTARLRRPVTPQL
jgi:hypothetical protein